MSKRERAITGKKNLPKKNPKNNRKNFHKANGNFSNLKSGDELKNNPGRPKGLLSQLLGMGIKREDCTNLASFMLQLSIDEIKYIAMGLIPPSCTHLFSKDSNIPIAMITLAHALIGDIKRLNSNTTAYLMELATKDQEQFTSLINNNIELLKKFIKKAVSPHFKNCWDNLKSENIFYGGSSSGKSVFCAHYLIYTLLDNSASNAVVVRQTSNTLDQSCINEICKWLDEYELQYTLNKTKKEIYLKIHGDLVQTIFFRGLDDVKKLLSMVPKQGNLSLVWIEEAIETSSQSYDILSTRLRGGDTEKRYIFSMNPISKGHWIYSRYFDPNSTIDNSDVFIHKSTYRDNPHLSEYDKKPILRLKETNPMFYEVFANGEWGTLGDLVFPVDSYEVLREEPNWDVMNLLCYGADFGILRDPTGLVAVYIDMSDRSVYLRELFYSRVPTIQDFAAILLTDSRVDVTISMICDTNPSDAVNVLVNNGINAVPARKGAYSIVSGIQSLIAIKPKIYGENIAREFAEYEYSKDKDGNNTGIPMDKNNHLIDAARYAIRDYTHIIIN